MTGWLIYSQSDAVKNNRYIQFYMEEGNRLDIGIQLIFAENIDFGVKDQVLFISYEGRATNLPDFAIVRTIYPLLSKQLEDLGVPVFNNSKIARICNDKAKTYQYIASLRIPTIDTIFCKCSMVRNKLENVSIPTVIKAVAGHGGSQVFLYDPRLDNDQGDIKNEILNKLKGCDVVLQPLVGSKHQDLRVYVIGNQIITAVLRTAISGFKSNFSLGGEVKEYKLSTKEIALVQNIINLFEIGLAGIDFIIGDNGELIFNEIEDVVGARMLYQCTDINLVGMYLEFIKEILME